MARKKSKPRVSLSKKQRESTTGSELLNLCRSITADGTISKDEIIALTSWLKANRASDLPAIQFLVPLVQKIVADGRVTRDEQIQLFQAIEKVLPPEDRKVAVQERRAFERKRQQKLAEKNRPKSDAKCPYCNASFEVSPKTGRTCPHCKKRFHVTEGQILTADEYNEVLGKRAENREAEWRGGRADAPTANQMAFMIRLGIAIPHGCTEEQASRLLDRANIPDDPTDEERAEYFAVRDEILDRMRQRGESVDEIIANPPSVGSQNGCASAGLLVLGVVALLSYWLV